MCSLKTFTMSTLSITLLACAASPDNTSLTVLTDAQPVPAVDNVPNQVHPEAAMRWQERDAGIVQYEKGFRHVLVTDRLDSSRDTASKESVAVIEAPVKIVPVTATFVDSNASAFEEALQRSLEKADELNNKKKDSAHAAAIARAWSKHCLHAKLSLEEQNLVDTTDMPDYLTEDCIPDK
jgi:hypothetical protein